MFFKKNKIEEIIETEEKECLKLTVMFKNGQNIITVFDFTDKTLETMNDFLDWFYRWKSINHYLRFNDSINNSVITRVFNRNEICYMSLEQLTQIIEKKKPC